MLHPSSTPKGIAPPPVSRSGAFSNSIGSVIERIRFETSYSGMEDAARFTSPEMRLKIAREARHRVTDNVLALTPDYEQTVRMALDPSLGALLHIRVLIVQWFHSRVRLVSLKKSPG